MDNNFDFDFAIKHWRAYVEKQFGVVDGDEIAENVFNEGVALINAEPELWADRGWAKMWDYIAQQEC